MRLFRYNLIPFLSRLKILIFTIFLVSFIHLGLDAQFKVKESSEKVKPNWILTPGPGFIVSKGSGNTIDEAKNSAIDSAVIIINKRVVEYMLNENMYFKGIGIDKNTALKLFMNSSFFAVIKAGNNEGIYWELLLDKKTKTESYFYFQKYNIDSETLSRVVQQIADENITLKLDTLQNQLNSIKNIEGLIKIRREIVFLKQLFPAENKSLLKIENLDKQVEGIFNKIEIAEMIHVPGRLAVTLILNSKALESSIAPGLKSECAQLLETNRLNERWTIDYSYNKCKEVSPLPIVVEFDFGFNKISKKFEINSSIEKIEVKIGNFDIVIKGNMLTFYVSSMYKKNLILERMVIRYNNLNFTDTPLRQILDGAGFYDISFSLPPGFENVKIDEKVRGELYFKSADTGQKGIFSFYNCEVKRN